jgi:dTDP-4-dehydrorhamnose 3,5-epimerase
MRLCETEIPGCYEVHFAAHRDARGVLVKTVHAPSFASLGLNADFRETFYTVSEKNVIRGMHFQLPPADHTKLVHCMAGAVTDICLDLRQGSPAFGRFAVVELSAQACNGMYLPKGVAHGFHVRQAPAIVIYQVSSEHAPAFESGVRWDSFGAPWEVQAPVLSPRDAALPPLQDFRTPFKFQPPSGGRPK